MVLCVMVMHLLAGPHCLRLLCAVLCAVLLLLLLLLLLWGHMTATATAETGVLRL